MRWWYFKRNGFNLILVPDSYFVKRPLDANPSNGNPHTPWYQHENHFDEHHVHVYASNYQSAYKKATLIITH